MDQRTNKIKSFIKKKIGAIAAIGAVMLIYSLAVILPGFSAVIYSPGSLLQPNDITSSHIRDGAILNADVSSTAAIDFSKLGRSLSTTSLDLATGTAANLSLRFESDTDTGFYLTAANDILFVNGGTERFRITDNSTEGVHVNSVGGTLPFRYGGDTNTNLFYGDSVNDRIGIGTSTPETLFHVNGTTTVEMGLVVNGTISGAGAAGLDDFALLGETTLSANATSVIVSSLPARKHLVALLRWEGLSASRKVVMRFNNDTGANYSYSLYGFSSETEAASSSIPLMSQSSNRGYSTVNIMNASSTGNRLVTFQSADDTGSAGTPRYINGGGVWGSTARISSITILLDGTATLATDTILSVYGSEN